MLATGAMQRLRVAGGVHVADSGEQERSMPSRWATGTEFPGVTAACQQLRSDLGRALRSIESRLDEPGPGLRFIVAQVLVIQTSQDQNVAACRDIHFNPLVLPTGIEPSSDPLLKFRAQAYAGSHRRRGRTLQCRGACQR